MGGSAQSGLKIDESGPGVKAKARTGSACGFRVRGRREGPGGGGILREIHNFPGLSGGELIYFSRA
jgi:hypothetical protein